MDTQTAGNQTFQYQKYKPMTFKKPFWAELETLEQDSIILQSQVEDLIVVLSPFVNQNINNGSVGGINMDAVEGQKSEEVLCEASHRLRTLRIRLIAVQRQVEDVKESLQI